MNITFDTNVLLSATLWDSSVAQKLLFRLINVEAKIFSSKEILSEYQNIIKRDFDYSDAEIDSILEKIFSFISLVTPSEKVEIVKEDPADNRVLECAQESNSDYIVTYDTHLLNLKYFDRIKIMKPEDMLKII